MTKVTNGISPTYYDGVGGIGGLDEKEQEVNSDDDSLFGEEGDNATGSNMDAGTGDAAAEALYEEWPDEGPSVATKDSNVAPEDEYVGCEEAPMRLPSHPSGPTPEERDRHNKIHLPHRSWCSVCVHARSREDKHSIDVSKGK